MCVSVRNSCKRSSDWFPSFDRHHVPLGRRVGQGKGLAVLDERFQGWEVWLKETFGYGWALTVPPFFLFCVCFHTPLPKLAPTTQHRVCSSLTLVWPPPQF